MAAISKARRDKAAPGTSYAYKASLVGAAQQFELTDDGLSWRVGGKAGLWPYATIASVRLSYRPVSMQSRRFRADLEDVGGARVSIISTTWQTVALMAPQDEDYRAFIVALHRRMQQVGSHAALVGGLKPAIHIGAMVLIALLGVAMTGLLARAVATAQWGGVLFIVGFAALFGWQVGGFIRRNKPRSYTFEELPKELLP
ncbi:hypothetical protein [Rhodopseudomonas sp.]|uniref:hypothetical protein n=1 Tax=Rhodopseudomonas sp. TaxID=1078 RepID=UPI0025DB0FB8|nr:hypothetical protein [Rhodopseudomonas sp.]